MPTVDQRMVEMGFNNANFEKGVNTTINSLNSLNTSLQIPNASTGLGNIQTAANNVNLSGVAAGVQSIASKFSLLGAVGFSVIQDLTKRMMSMGGALYNALTGPLIQGGKARALSIEQAKFQFRGLGMDVDKTMASAKAAVLGTAFGLDDAAKAAAMFGASGMRAGKEMTGALRGIAGIAAMSGSGYADIADIFTKVAGQGRLMGEDLNRMAARGVNAAATIGKALGKSEAEVRDMVTKGKISFKVFSQIMDDAFGEHATKASETFVGSVSNMKAALARIGAQYFTYQFEGLRKIFVALTPVIDRVAAALKPLIDIVGKGMDDAAKGIANFLGINDSAETKLAKTAALTKLLGTIFGTLKAVFTSLKSAMLPIMKAFTDIFPPKTIVDAQKMAEAIDGFVKKMLPGAGAIATIAKAFKGLFAIFSLVGKVAGFIGKAIYTAIDVLLVATGITDGIGQSFGALVTSVSDYFIALNESANNSSIFTDALTTLRDSLEKLAVPIKATVDHVRNAITIFQEWVKQFQPLIDGIKSVFGALGNFVADFFKPLEDGMSSAEKGLTLFKNVFAVIGKAIAAIVNFLTPYFKQFAATIKAMTLDDLLKTFLTLFAASTFASVNGFLHESFIVMRKFIPNFRAMSNEFTFALQGMQSSLNAGALKSIATAVLILAVAMLLMSTINPAKLAASAAGVTALLGELMLSMKIFVSANGKGGDLKGILSVSFALTMLSLAIILLSVAVKKLSALNPDELTKGLIGVGTLLGALGIFVKYVKVDANMVGVGFGILLMSVALLIFAKAVKNIGSMDQNQLITAMTTIGAFFALIIGLSNKLDLNKIASLGLSIIAVSVGIAILAVALRLLGGMNPEALSQGLIAMGVGLLMVIAAMDGIPKDAIARSASVLVMAIAISILAGALAVLGNMSMESLSTAIIGLGATLIMLIIALNALGSGSALMGAAALVIVSIGLTFLAKALQMMAAIPFGSLMGALLGLALALVVIGVAGYLLIPAIPGLLGFGVAMLALGLAVFLAGVGIGLFAAGIGVLATALTVGGGTIIAFILSFASILPMLALALAKSLGAFALGLIEQQGVITLALVALFTTVLNALIKVMPVILNFFNTLIQGIVSLLVTNIPIIVNALLLLLVSIMIAIRAYLPIIITLAGDIMVAFINGMAVYYSKIIAAGVDFIIALIQGIAGQILKIVNAAMRTILAFIDGLTTAVKVYGPQIRTAVGNLMNAILGEISKFLGLDKFTDVGGKLVAGITKGIKAATAGPLAAISAVIDKILGAARAAGIIQSPSKLLAKGVGEPLSQGIAMGIVNAGKTAIDAGKATVLAVYSAMTAANDAANNILIGIADPTIRPVVDLDAVYQGAKDIASVMGKASAISVAGDVNGRVGKTGSTSTTPATATDASGNGTGPTFVQNNYSPKALDSLEVYRQTQNQIRQISLGGTS